ncbi:MAG TPA: hypothetical protein VII45_03945 [Solirubrobacterales bacterium]
MKLSARIVLFEPDPVMRDLLRDHLQAEGCTVLAFDDVSRAASVRKGTADLLICNIATRADVAALCEFRCEDVPVIAMTRRDRHDEALAAGLDFVIDKPFHFSQMRELLVAALALGDRLSVRDSARLALGQTVLSSFEAVLGDDALARSDYGQLLERAVEAFPHTSISELVAAMVGGICERGH